MAKKKREYKGVGKGLFKNTKKGSPREGLKFRLEKQGGETFAVYPGKPGVRKPQRIRLAKPGAKPKAKKPEAPPYNPLQPLTGKAFTNQVSSQVNAAFRPQEQQIESERRISTQAERNIGNWYDQYRNQVQQAAANTQQAYQGAQQSAYNQANQATSTDIGQQQQLQEEANRQAQVRGLPAAPVDPNAAGGISARQALSSAFGGLLGAQGAGQYGYLQSRAANTQAQKIGALSDEGKRRAQIELTSRNLTQKKGEERQKIANALTQQERDYFMKTKALDLDVAQAQSDAIAKQQSNALKNKAIEVTKRGQNIASRDRRRAQNIANQNAKANRQIAWRRVQQSDRKYKLELRKFGEAQAKENYLKRNSLGAYKPGGAAGRKGASGPGGAGLPSGVTPAARNKAQAKFANSIERGRIGKDNSGKPIRTNSFNWIYANLIDAGLPPLQAEVAALRIKGRYPSNKMARKLWNQYGIKVQSKAWPA